MNEKEQYFQNFNKGLHRIGKVMTFIAMLFLLAVPFVIAKIYDASINWNGFGVGFAKVAAVYIPVSIVEFLVYTPMLGTGGSYISFITGNVTNMKIPCAINARDIAKTEVGTPENEIISTISTATSAIVTTLVVAVGVVLIAISPLEEVLEHPTLAPAFDNVLAALFGALALKYFIKSPKLAVVPVFLVSLLCIFVPSMITDTGTLVIASGALALAIGFALFKKGKL